MNETVHWRWWIQINGETKRWFISKSEAMDAGRISLRRHDDVCVLDRSTGRRWRLELRNDGGQEWLLVNLEE